MSHSFLIPGCSLQQLILDLNSIHDKRNQREGIFTTLGSCFDFLDGIHDAIISEVAKRQGRRAPGLVANFMKRFFTLVGVWGVDQFLGSLVTKYPASGCGYCHQLPCACGPEKAAPWTHTSISLDPIQSNWSLGNWQSHHALVYGQRDVERSFEQVLLSQISEFSEARRISRWLENARTNSYPASEVGKAQQALSLELADLFMRTLAVANRYEGGFDVETLVLDRYRDGCSKCRQRYCVCPNHAANFELFESETLAATRIAP